MASTDRRAVGIFPSRTKTASALQALSDSGFSMADVSVIAKDAHHQADIAGVRVKDEVTNQADKGGTVGAATGGLLGGVTGLLVGLGTLTIPGLGPALLAGEAAVVLATLVGGAAGAAAGGLVGALIGLGIPEHRAARYQERVAQGDYLIMVKGTEAAIARAQQTLGGAGIEDWGVYETAGAPRQVEPQAGVSTGNRYSDRRNLDNRNIAARDLRPDFDRRPTVDDRHDLNPVSPLDSRDLHRRPLVDERQGVARQGVDGHDLNPVPPLDNRDPNRLPLVNNRQDVDRQGIDRHDLNPVLPLDNRDPNRLPLIDERQGVARQGIDRQHLNPVPPLDSRELNRQDFERQDLERQGLEHQARGPHDFERHDIEYRDLDRRNPQAEPAQPMNRTVADFQRDRDLYSRDRHPAAELPHASNPLPTAGAPAAAQLNTGDRYVEKNHLEERRPEERRTEERRVVGIFLNQGQMEEALAQLQKTGFAMHTLSIAVREANSPDTQHNQPYGGHSLAGATRLTAGLDRVILPEIGTLLVMGPDADALSRTFVAYQSGREEATDQGLGIAPESAHLYRRHITDGAYLVTLRGRNQDVLQAATTLGEWGMRDWGIYDVWQR